MRNTLLLQHDNLLRRQNYGNEDFKQWCGDAGAGVRRLPGGRGDLRCVSDALAAGYRSIDTAAAYMNERAVARAVRRSGIPARGAGGYGTDRRARHEAELFPLAPRSADGRMARDYEV